jgi:hypothetical protein
MDVAYKAALLKFNEGTCRIKVGQVLPSNYIVTPLYGAL